MSEGLLPSGYAKDEAAIEETYVNRNGAATLKLGEPEAAPAPADTAARRPRPVRLSGGLQ